jgi:transposase InsO family protein
VDNRKQFDCQDFREYCRSIGTKLCFAFVYHPQSNGAVERANGQIFSAINKCLFEQKKGKWVNELSRVIWSHNTRVKNHQGHSIQIVVWGRRNVPRRARQRKCQSFGRKLS